jgi:cytosine/adenosine deaminase-related metal-dependent hydrolase
LGHGRAPLNSFLKRGIAVGLGSDSVASNNNCDILEEARFALLSARADTTNSAESQLLSATEAMRLATYGGSFAIGRAGQTGELTPGQQADFVAFSLDSRHQLPSYDPLDTLVFSSSGRENILTVIGGREVYRDGIVTTIDEDWLRGRVKEIARRLKV